MGRIISHAGSDQAVSHELRPLHILNRHCGECGTDKGYYHHCAILVPSTFPTGRVGGGTQATVWRSLRIIVVILLLLAGAGGVSYY